MKKVYNVECTERRKKTTRTPERKPVGERTEDEECGKWKTSFHENLTRMTARNAVHDIPRTFNDVIVLPLPCWLR